MSFGKSPLFHFIIGTLWAVAAAVTAFETQEFIGPVFWPPVIFGAAAIFFYTRCISLAMKRKK